MNKLPDFYRLLHVQPDAPVPVIKASYRAMMQKMQHHPDLGGDEAIAQRLNEAVATLCDPVRRATYDVKLALQARQLFNNSGNDTEQSSQQEDTRKTEHPESGPKPSSTQHQNHQSKDSKNSSKRDTDNPGQKAKQTAAEPPTELFPVKPRCPFCQANYPAPSRLVHSAYASEIRCTRCHGAITPISAIDPIDHDELRKIHRYHHKSAASLWQHWPLDEPLIVTMIDLSPAGCALESTVRLTLDSVVLFDTELLNAICRVRYCKQLSTDNTFAIGLEFLTLQILSTPGAIFSSSA